MSAAAELIAERPVPGQPRPYDFPDTFRTAARQRAARDRHADARARARLGVARPPRRRRRTSPTPQGGATVLAARGLTEGTEVRDAIALTEAAERLGASLHAESGWDATSAGVDVPEAAARRRRSSSWPRSSAGRRSRSPRSTGSATSA